MHNTQPLKCRDKPPPRSTESIYNEPGDSVAHEENGHLSATVRRRMSRLREKKQALNPDGIKDTEILLELNQGNKTYKVPRVRGLYLREPSPHDRIVLKTRGIPSVILKYQFTVFFPTSQFDSDKYLETVNNSAACNPENKVKISGHSFKGFCAKESHFNFIHLGLVDRMGARRLVTVIDRSHLNTKRSVLWDPFVGKLPDYFGVLLLDFEIDGHPSRAPFIVSYLDEGVTLGKSWETRAEVKCHNDCGSCIIDSCKKPIYKYPYI